MKLLKDTVLNEMREMHEKNMKIRIIGDLAPLKPELKKLLKETEELTFNNTGLNFQIAINYGSRNEIAQAVKNIARDFKAGIIKSEDEISEDLISKYLYTYEIPDPDLLIRTGGEQRVSNYLLWQIAYSELYVTNVFWPDFNKEELQKAFMAFSERKRRFGRD
jgi:undecaprenyl diphosphate synthase